MVLLSLLALSCLHEISDRVGKQNDIRMGLADLCFNGVECAYIKLVWASLGHLRKGCSQRAESLFASFPASFPKYSGPP